MKLEVFNLLGQRLATLVDAEQVAGAHTALWDATNAAGQAVSAGVYIYRLTVGAKHQTGRMVLIDGQAGVPVPGRTPQPVPLAEVVTRAAVRLGRFGPRYHPLYSPQPSESRQAWPRWIWWSKLLVVTPRPKVAEGGILGDVDGNGVVDIVDALIVAMYSVYPSIDLPSNSNISLGDVNYDGQIDFIDAYLIGTYSVDPSDPLLPEGIGQAVTAADSPDPDLTGDSPPLPPTNVRWQYGRSVRYSVSWDPAPRATFYEVYWDGATFFSPSCPGGCRKIATVENTSIEHNPDSNRNGYWLKACNDAGCSQWVSADWRLLLVAETASASAVTLRLIEHTYLTTNIRDAVQLSAHVDAKVNISSVSRVSDTEVTVELTFDDTDTTTGSFSLKFIVDAGAIANYDGPDLVDLVGLYPGADLAVEISVDDSSPDAGENIYLSATVQNLGSGPVPFPNFTLDYYLSTDATISTSDMRVSGDVMSSVSESSSWDEQTYVKAPSTPGTYYYGACVPVLLGESDSTNNCSRAVPVTISGDG